MTVARAYVRLRPPQTSRRRERSRPTSRRHVRRNARRDGVSWPHTPPSNPTRKEFHMARIKFRVVVLAALLFALSATAFAQLETGQITGRVTDPNGAVVPGAAVILKSVETGAERAATSDADGAYT